MIIKKIRNKNNPQELAFYTYGNVPGQALLSGLIGLSYNIPAAPFREKNCGCKVMLMSLTGKFYDELPVEAIPEDTQLVTVYDPHNLIQTEIVELNVSDVVKMFQPENVTVNPKRGRPKKNVK